jgi:hypothetical protein
MHKILAKLTFGLSLFSFSAQADSFACYQALESKRFVNKNEAVAICAGGDALGVTTCLNAALNERTLSNNEAKGLCVGALSDAPIKCYQKLRRDRTQRIVNNSADALMVCRGTTQADGAWQCLIAAEKVRGLSNIEAKALCSGAVDASPVTCYERAEADRTLSASEALALCRIRDRFRP